MRIFTTCLILLLLTSVVWAEEWYVGNWRVDVDATLEYAKSSPKYDPRGADMVRKFAEAMNLVITPETLTFVMGSRQQPMSYKVTSSAANKATLLCEAKGQTAEMQLTRTTDGLLNLKSSSTDDMDYYLWAK